MNLRIDPPTGTYDWHPEEFVQRKYIFDIWRSTCLSFGFEEYLTPILENAELYKLKSGGDIRLELLSFKKEKEELAIRPEMTPSVCRMVSKFYNTKPKPIKLFSIANFYRFQKPQRGRNREFWQLNCDIFGSNNVLADVEVIKLAVQIMNNLGADDSMFVILLNYRPFVRYFLSSYLSINEDKHDIALSIFDKYFKLSKQEFLYKLHNDLNVIIRDEKEFWLLFDDTNFLLDFINTKYLHVTNDRFFTDFIKYLEICGLSKYIRIFLPLVRGLTYYTGMVFELFDKQILNLSSSNDAEIIKRSIFGGGRYDNLSDIFGIKHFYAVGFAPGDETIKLFLQKYNLMPQLSTTLQVYFLPILKSDFKYIAYLFALADFLRKEGLNIFVSNSTLSITKALDFANRKNFGYVIIFGDNEIEHKKYVIKNMRSGVEVVLDLPIHIKNVLDAN
ncbi:MAG: ATP phosphoribosyltransferase regulatory subunit [Candidatus Dojkabacteria bacterium]|nr:ATP phosphoribosyltransferase regulatory subunit [Candidatus Dojkabacteria bacterium]